MWSETSEELIRNKNLTIFKKQFKQILRKQYENWGCCVKTKERNSKFKSCFSVYRVLEKFSAFLICYVLKRDGRAF